MAMSKEQLKVLAWREKQLMNAGMPLLNARGLAIRPYVDLHQAVDMLHAGCSPSCVLEILA